jgi:F-type H+-transporting ATPase subunit delta
MATSSRQLKDIAQALVDVAMASNSVVETLRSVEVIRDVFAADRSLTMQLTDPSVSLAKRRSALKKALHGQVDELALNALLVLQEKDLLDELNGFGTAVLSAARTRAGHHQAMVTTAVALNADERASLGKALMKKFGGMFDVAERIDSKLVGGLIIDVDGWRYDASVAGACRRLKQTLSTP